ncbi:leukemia-associated protein 7 [Mixophyes fleayi]|uniref:leukemia-associated protein 7 n=1 Tax=Mixophyes fleayi TaxID=3061075 RepID=UPI003F4DC7C0
MTTMKMTRPALVKEAVIHQAQAFNTLIFLMDKRGIRSNDLNMYIVEDSSLPDSYTAATHRADTELEAVDAGSASSRPLTLSQRASGNRLSRVARCTLEILALEEKILDHLPLGHQFPMQLKDSIELRNICTHMALQTDDRRFDQDLKSAQECLITIINNMAWDVAANSCDFCDTVREQLKQILQKLYEG